ncbi:hypothetical protein [Kingella oralis]|uniref:hypothetical protein n=1 Tax=Kingella oralis TaxID=505 RepID=UPI0034E3FDF9
MVRDWVNQNRAAFAEQGGEIEEREGVDWDGAAFYMVDCIMPHCVARIMVTMPAFYPFRFVSMEVLSVETEEDLFRWHDGGCAATGEAIQTALRHLQEILLATQKAA